MGDGATAGDHAESADRQFRRLGRKPKAEVLPEGPAFPAPLDYLWAFFQEISAGIAGNGMSYPNIGWGDILDWSALTQTELAPWEARALVDIGNRRANILSESAERQARDNPDPHRTDQQLSRRRRP